MISTAEEFMLLLAQLYCDKSDDYVISVGHWTPGVVIDMPEAGSYLLVISNQQKVSGDLAELERDLYEYGLSEGMLEATNGIA